MQNCSHDSKPDFHIDARQRPLPPSKEAPQPFQTYARPFHARIAHRPGPIIRSKMFLYLIHCSASQRCGRGVHGFQYIFGQSGCGMFWFGGGWGGEARGKPVTSEIEEAAIWPVAWGEEENQKESRAVDAWSVEEVGEGYEGEDEQGAGVRGDEKERQPTGESIPVS